MMKHLLSTSAILLALTMPASAQTTTTEQPATPQPSVTDNKSVDQTGGAQAQEAIIPEQAANQIRAEDLMGARVIGPGGEEIGKVDDLIFDENEKIAGVVVGVGGFLGFGEKNVGLNRDQADLRDDPDTGQKTVVVSLTKADLEAAPDFMTKQEREAGQRAAAQQQELQQQQQAPPVPSNSSTTTQ